MLEKRGKAIRPILGALAISLLAAALWEYVLSPMLNSTTYQIILYVGSIFEGYVNDIYANIAERRVDRASAVAAKIFIYFYTVVCAVSLIVYYFSLKGLDDSYEKLESIGKDHVDETGEVLIEKYKKLLLSLPKQRRNNKYRKWGLFIAVLVVLSIIASDIADNAKEEYAKDAIGHYDRLLAIIAPHITPEEKLVFDSRFAQIENRDEYIKIIQEITRIAKVNNLRVPKFKII